MVNPALCGYVCEVTIAIIVIELRQRRAVRASRFERRAIHKKDVVPSVAIEIENGHTVSGGLQDVILLRFPPIGIRLVQTGQSPLGYKMNPVQFES